jgi:hypothetical protein
VKRITEAPRHRSHPDDALAIKLGPRNVRVNAILPGVAEGERMDRVISTRAQALGISFDQMKDERLEKISLRRMVTVHDAAAMTPFLASPAGRNISGQAISVDENDRASRPSRSCSRDTRRECAALCASLNVESSA